MINGWTLQRHKGPISSSAELDESVARMCLQQDRPVVNPTANSMLIALSVSFRSLQISRIIEDSLP